MFSDYHHNLPGRSDNAEVRLELHYFDPCCTIVATPFQRFVLCVHSGFLAKIHSKELREMTRYL